MKSKYVYAFAGLMLGLTACSNEDLISQLGQQKGETVFVSLKVDRNKAETRTIITETDVPGGVGLSNVWAQGDQVTLVSETGEVAGILTLEGEGGDSEGIFSGELTINNGEYDVWYLGADGAYAEFKDGTLINSLAIPDCKVSGNFTDLNKGDIMNSKVEIIVKDGNATITESVKLDAQMAMAHFTLSGEGIIDSLSSEGSSLTFAYGEYSYNITSVGADLYVPMIPGTYTPSFKLKAGDKTYSYTFANATKVEAGLYYAIDKGVGKGVTIPLTEDTTPVVTTPLVEEVGPVIEYGGKKWRFTRGNLTFNVKNQEWSILSDQSQYIYACGLGKDEINQDNTIPSAGLGVTPDVIGLFSWGATGLEDARKPWSIRFDSSTKTVDGNNWPSTITTNSTITDLLANDYVYDWGHAYELRGRAENDNRQYITPPASVFKTLMEGCFVQGATIIGIGENGTDVTGIICIPNCNLESVKILIDNTDGVEYSSELKDVLHNHSGSTLNYKYIKITDYSAIKKLNDAVFFPSSGKMMLNGGSVTKSSTTEGWYWSATGIGSTGNNAKNLHFYGPGTSSGNFYYKADVKNGVVESNRANNPRYVKMAVRLLVEVDD